MTPKEIFLFCPCFDLVNGTIFCFLPLQAQCARENVPACGKCPVMMRCEMFNLLGLNKGAGQGDFLSPGFSPVLGLSSLCLGLAQCRTLFSWPLVAKSNCSYLVESRAPLTFISLTFISVLEPLPLNNQVMIL